MPIDLSKVVSQAFQAAENAVQGLLKSATYTHYDGTGTYDPVTGNTGGTPTAIPLTNVILTSFKQTERTTEFASTGKRGTRVVPEVGDMKLLVPAASLPVSPSMQDTVTLNGEVWEVKGFQNDPTGTGLITILIRRA